MERHEFGIVGELVAPQTLDRADFIEPTVAPRQRRPALGVAIADPADEATEGAALADRLKARES